MSAPFFDWLSGASIYIGYDRYGSLGRHGFVCASMYEDSDELREAIDDLASGDNDALPAAEWIKNDGRIVYGADENPAAAMQILVMEMRGMHSRISEAQRA